MTPYQKMKEMYEFAIILGGNNKKNRLSVLNAKHKIGVRSSMKRIADPLLFPLTSESRIYYPREDGESWVEYGIMEDKGYSYEELKEFWDDQYVTTGCAWSPSGRPFTRYIHWKRTPVGIAYAIYWGLDV